MLGGDAIAKMLAAEGVDKVFGIIDGTYFGLYSSLQKYNIELISPRHEACAVHMAGTYARLTGKIGVCIASNGPGVANLLSGIAVENTEGNRVMAITSSRRMQIIYPDRGGSYQCFDQTGAIRAISKYSEAVKTHERVIEIMRQAFRKTYMGRPGVVHVDCPESIMNGHFDYNDSHFLKPHQYRDVTGMFPHPKLVQEALDILKNARFPLIHAGSGVIHARAYEELKVLAEHLSAPITTSWGARGVLEECNELSIPMIHVEINNDIRNEADVVLVLGSRLGETDWWGKAPNWAPSSEQKVIQVDIDNEFIGRNKPITVGIQADVKLFMQELYHQLKNTSKPGDFSFRRQKLAVFRKKIEAHRHKLDENLQDFAVPMNTAHIAKAAGRVLGDDTVAVFDGGNTAVWGQFFYGCNHPGRGLGTPKMGMLGAGVAQALGASAAYPDKYVYCMIGDGAMAFNMQEIETAVRNDMKIIFLIAVDKQWGMVKMNQQFMLKPLKTLIKKSLDASETINADFIDVAWDQVANAMGAFGVRVSDPKKLDEAIKACVDSKKPGVVHIDVDNVKHMWAPSLIHFKKMHEEPKGK